MRAFTVLQPPLKEYIETTDSAIALILSVFLVGFALAGFLPGYVFPKYGSGFGKLCYCVVDRVAQIALVPH